MDIYSVLLQIRNFTFFQVEAYDEGFPDPFTDITNVTIFLVGENDEPPSIIFPDEFPPTVPENEPPGYQIVYLANYTFDPDMGAGGEFNFTLVEIFDPLSEEGNDSFSLNTTTGLLTALRVFDREAQPEGIVIAIETSDFGEPPQSQVINITVVIGDRNDKTPYFPTNLSIVAYELLPPGDQILQEFRAIDEDIGINAELEYEIIDGDPLEEFSMDPLTGGLFTASTLNKTNQTYYNLTVMVRDRGTPPLQGFGLIEIEVIDSNDNTPTFTMEGAYVANISENEPMGTFILRVVAFDLDEGTNSEIQYFLNNVSNFSTAVNGRFSLHPTTGELFSNDVFDRENDTMFVVHVVAIDNGEVPSRLTGSATVQVIVLDQNDASPVFHNASYSADVVENAPNRTHLFTVSASDADAEAPNYQIVFSLDGPRSDLLHIEPTSGDVTVAAEIDWEEGEVINITVMATDRGEPPHTSTAIATIFIEDVNDQAPFFPPGSLSIGILENMEPPALATPSVQAVDLDSEGNGSMVVYEVVNDLTDGRFTLNSVTGEVTFVRGMLNRERRPLYQMIIRARDHGDPPLYTDGLLNIFVLDANDFDPVFSQDHFLGSIPENAPLGTTALTLLATDMDIGSNAELSFSLQENSAYFSVNESTGEVFTVTMSFDFETTNNYSFAVSVSDYGNPPRNHTSQVTVVITDFNDNRPIFEEESYSMEMEENLAPYTTVLQVASTDTDSETNHIIRYSLAEGEGVGYFDIDPETGVLHTTRYINREITPSFDITVVANNTMSSHPLWSNVSVNVTILDLPDTHPSFDVVTHVYLEEDVAMGPIFNLSATDGDEGLAGVVRYNIMHGNEEGLFNLDPITGSVDLTAELDFEAFRFHEFVVSATDMTTPTNLVNYTTVLVHVIDVNDNPPLFVSSEYTVTVDNLIAIDTMILDLVARDADSGTNSELQYGIEEGSEYFDLQSSSQPSLYVTQSLEHQVGETISLVVTVRNPGTADSHVGQANVTIHIQESLSTLPLFTQLSLETSVSEAQTPPAMLLELSLLTINVESYEIESGNTGGAFSVSDDGILSLSPGAVLDYETQSTYQLTIRAENMAGVSYRILTISVDDVNDIVPQFVSSPFLVYIPETTPMDMPFFTAMAIDNDGSSPANEIEINFHGTVSEEIERTFAINPLTGQISLRRELDYESGDRNFTFEISASNEGVSPSLSSVTTMTIVVINGNNHAPEFTSVILEPVQLYENQTVGLSIFNASATDNDEGSSGEITYGLQGNHRYFDFSIDTVSGEVVLNGELDRERQTLYQLVIVAADRGNPGLTSTSLLVVGVQDVNDNTPEWVELEYSTSIYENTTVGDIIIVVEAMDIDQFEFTEEDGEVVYHAVNGLIHYSITDGDPRGHFNIFTTPKTLTGVVTISVPLDREEQDFYSLTLTATDGGGRTANSLLLIEIIDVNDVAPYFTQDEYVVAVPENSENGTFVVTVSASDTDSYGDSSFFYYEIESGNIEDVFAMNSSTGSVWVEIPLLDREYIPVYNLTVVAIDFGGPSLTGTTQILVHLLDENEFPPVFDQEAYYISIPEDTPLYTAVLNITTSDLDYLENATAIYSLLLSQISTSFDSENFTYENSTLFDNENSTLFDSDNSTAFDSDNFTLFDTENFTSFDSENFTMFDSYNLTSFDIDPTSGQLFVVENLDFEVISEYNFIVKATDSGPTTSRLSSEANITVIVTDINDNVPTFLNASYAASIREDAPPLSPLIVLEAFDHDSGANAELYFSLDPLGDIENFVLDPQTGLLSLSHDSHLDYEFQSAYEFIAMVTDSGTPSLNSSVMVTIEIEDVNDNAPVFISPFFNSSVVENFEGLAVVDIAATDADSGENSQITYEILREIDSESDCIITCSSLELCTFLPNLTTPQPPPFTIHNITGMVTTSVPLDREERDTHLLVITATDSGREIRLSATTCLQVTILDENDEVPTFPEDGYEGSISEATGEGVVVVRVKAEDGDDGTNAEVTYQIVSESSWFAVHPLTGDVVTLGGYDRETRDMYDVVVVATDSGVPPLNSTTVVRVTITDENDNAPEFDQSDYSISFPENESPFSSVLLLQASDRDIGTNSQLTFSIQSSFPQDHFLINATSGLLQSAVQLDREEITSYMVAIISTDMGDPPLSSSVTVNIAVVDVNDNAPLFTESEYSTYVNENTVLEDPLLQVAITDNDVGANSLVQFVLNETRPHVESFAVDSSSGAVSLLSPLDAEMSLSYTLTIIAINDRATPQLTTAVNVTVAVGDLNDHTPSFSQPEYVSVVLESVDVRSEIIDLNATDDDATETNSELKFEIIGGHNLTLFSIDPQRGSIFTTGPLDREREPTHILQVRVTDNGTEPGPLDSEVNVTFVLRDVNDNVPVFNQTRYRFTVHENESPGILIGRVRASDVDLQNLTYSISTEPLTESGSGSTSGLGSGTGSGSGTGVSGSGVPPGDYFNIHPTTGEIFTAASFDREERDVYLFLVVAADSGSLLQLSSEVVVKVEVLDRNDIAPSFSLPTYSVAWSEATPPDSALLTVSATDRDLEESGVVEYLLKYPNPDSNLFSINSTSGVVSLIGEFDREIQDMFLFEVIARDYGVPSLASSVNIMITILDVNDNIPQLNASNYSAVLHENTPLDYIILGVAASDADISSNAEIMFSLSQDFNSTFAIGSSSGFLSLSSHLDFETQEMYSFSVIATDHGDPPLSTSAMVTITITDLNDNPPIFASDTYHTAIPENAILGTPVFQIPATDSDSTSNGELRYSILAGNLDSAFLLDERSGLISLQDHLDREVTAGYSLSLRAVDQGSPQFTAHTELLIRIEDVNDHIPEFESNVFHASILEQSGTGTLVAVVEARDADVGTNANLTYSIIAGDPRENFEIAPDTGKVTVRGVLDYEAVPSQSLTVLVSDQGEPEAHSNTAVLSISILDDNEHPPSYRQSLYTIDVPDNTPPGAFMGSFPANDRDSYQLSSLHYSLANHSNASFFSIDPFTGDLHTHSLLPPSQELFVSILASDGDYTVDLGVSVNVFPLSSSLPIFEPHSFIFSVNEDTSVGERVGSLTLSTVGEDDVAFSLVSESLLDFPFEVTLEGHINLIGQLDYETTPTWLFGVQAVSTLNSSHLSHAVVTMEIFDTNDNPPIFESDSYHLIISELTPVTSHLLTLPFYDLDSPGTNPEVEFSITGGNEGGRFDLNPLTGELRVADLLDYEDTQRFVLNISVTDSTGEGGHLSFSPLSSTALVWVELLDENDHAPQFGAPYYQASVPSSAEEGTPVLMLTAQDPDSGSNSDLSFFITHSDLPLSFTVNHTTGVIATGPDFQGDDADSYVVSTAVSDKGSPQPLTDTAIIFITVVPDNNFPPEFSLPDDGYSVSVPETLPVQSPVVQVSASDPDSPESLVIYSIISGDPHEIFSIGTTSGLLSLAGELDYLTQSLYLLEITAVDGGTPPRTSSITVNISIEDVNNHSPVFPTPHYTVSVLENITVGTTVVNITATDLDANSITYLISLNSFSGEIPLFTVDNETGVLTTAAELDREVAGIHHLLVSAVDSGYNVRLSNSVPVTVTLIDLNDTPPQFDQSEYLFPLLRYTAESVDVAKVTATDGDLIGQELEYDIVGDTSGGVVGVNSTSGVLFTRGYVPEESLGEYELIVTVYDGVFLTSVPVTLQLTSDGYFCEGMALLLWA